MMRAARLLLGIFVALTTLRAATEPLTAANDLFYNMDFDEALAAFEKISAATPNDADGHNHIANTLLYRELARNGALESQMVSGNNSFIRRLKMEPPPDVEKRFFAELDRSIGITIAALSRNPKDTAAMHSQANAYALRATYGFLVRKTWIASLGDASRAYKLDKEVYALDPKNIDALMLVGGYDYIVGYLPWHMRTLGFIAGFRGDKDRGLKTMERVAREGNASRRDMQFTLCALYRREGQAAKAIPMLQELIAAYPRNYLLRFELAQMYGAVGEREKALAVLADVAKRRQTNVAGYTRVTQEKIDYETGNLQFWFNDFEHALESLRKVTSSPALKNDLDLNTGALAFMRQGQIYDLTNRHNLAIPLYRSAIQYAPEAEAAKESQRYLGSPYKRSAKS